LIFFIHVKNKHANKKHQNYEEAGPAGIEPVTDGLRVRCSALLSYGPKASLKKFSLRNIELTVFIKVEAKSFGENRGWASNSRVTLFTFSA
jgi:hypothetical protein